MVFCLWRIIIFQNLTTRGILCDKIKYLMSEIHYRIIIMVLEEVRK